mmetsp:Transcript_38981/g.81945  ORF Transcript_38981/g.81945 Transcript_38981/m.81945 type:complete len:85 (+) Transcript_38981:1136-1390(+)
MLLFNGDEGDPICIMDQYIIRYHWFVSTCTSINLRPVNLNHPLHSSAASISKRSNRALHHNDVIDIFRALCVAGPATSHAIFSI